MPPTSESPQAPPDGDRERPRSLLRDPALRYLAFALALGVGIFGVLRLGWVERQLLLPFTAVQERAACALLGEPSGPIVVGLSCSAAEVIALCLGAVLAFPVPWRRRLAGAAAGLLLIVGLNTLRIGTLGRAAANRELFELLHVYLWPGALVAAVTAFVFLWMRLAQTDRSLRPAAAALRAPATRPLVRLAVVGAVLLAAYLALAPRLLDTAAVASIAAAVAAFAASTARLFGLEAVTEGIVFRTAHGAFLVTPECVATPLLPVYLAGAAVLPSTPWRRAAALAAAVPLFFLLAAARLLVLVLPPAAVGSPVLAVHGFRQILLGAVLVVATAWWRRREHEGGWPRRAAMALAAAAGLGWLAGPLWGRAVEALVRLAGAPTPGGGLPDPQGALLLLAPFQIALFAGVCLAWGVRGRAPLVAAAALALAQLPLALAAGFLWERAGFLFAARDLRAWAVAAPLIAAWLALRPRGRARREQPARPPVAG